MEPISTLRGVGGGRVHDSCKVVEGGEITARTDNETRIRLKVTKFVPTAKQRGVPLILKINLNISMQLISSCPSSVAIKLYQLVEFRINSIFSNILL